MTGEPLRPRHEDFFAFGIKNMSEDWQLGLSCLLEAERMAAESGDSWNAATYARIAAGYLRRYNGLEEAVKATERAIQYCPEDANNYQFAGNLCFPSDMAQAIRFYRLGADLGCETCQVLAWGLSSAFPGDGR